jgi:hypothetical protein
MHAALTQHPTEADHAVTSITVRVTRDPPFLLTLEYTLTADLRHVQIPARSPSTRVDGLWRHTCFEAFVRGGANPSYCELNFSPSGEWAAYSFTSYREGMAAIERMPAPRIVTQASGSTFRLEASIDLAALAGASGMQQPLKLAVSAVVEHLSGRLLFWALWHPPGKADFHHPDSFVLEIP